MAKAATPAANATAGRKASAKPATSAGSVEGAEEEAEKAAAEAAAKAETEANNARLQDLKGQLSDVLSDIQTADKDNAIAARLGWVKVGDLLIEGRSMFTKGNNANDVAFGRWIADQGLTALGQRPTRAAAIWLAETHNKNPDLYALFPTESRNGDPLRRSPRTLKDWVREQVNAVFQIAYEAAGGDIAIASEQAEQKDREATARDAMPNVFDSLAEVIDAADAAVGKASDDLKAAKGAEARAKASEDFSRKSDVLETYQGYKDVLDAVTDDDRLSYFMAWKPKVASVSFKDCTPEEAAERLFALLKSHEQFSAVYEALGVMVEAAQAKVDADAAAVASTGDDANAGGDEFAAEGDDEDATEGDFGGDADEEGGDFGDDEGDDANFKEDADAAFPEE